MKLTIRGVNKYPGMGDDEDEKEIEHVCVKRIKNGFVLCPMGESEEASQFVKTLSESPTILAKMFGIENKSASEIKDMTEYTEKESEGRKS